MPTIEVSDETYAKIKDQLMEDEKFDMSTLDDLLLNKSFFFRTVTYHLVGKVTGRIGMLLALKEASWIADSGGFMDCIKNGKLNEVEPVGIAFINLNTVTDFFPWKHQLPKERK